MSAKIIHNARRERGVVISRPATDAEYLLAWRLFRDRLLTLAQAFDALVVEGAELTDDDRFRKSDPAALRELQERHMALDAQIAPVIVAGKALASRTARKYPEGISGEMDSLRHECAALMDFFEVQKGTVDQLFAAEMGERFADKTGVAVNQALGDWQIHALDDEHRAALMRLLTRKPKRRGAPQRWRELIRREGPEGMVRWWNRSIRGVVRDSYRRVPWRAVPVGDADRPPPHTAALAVCQGTGAHRVEVEEEEIRALIAAADLTPALEAVAIAALVRHESIAEMAKALGITPGTVRVRLHRATKRIEAAQLKTTKPM